MKKLEKKSLKIILCADAFRINSNYDAEKSHLCLVMKVSGSSLRTYVSEKELPFEQRRLLAINTTETLIHLHQNDIILEGEYF